MKTIIVNKMGLVFGRENASGEQGETLAVIDRLMRRSDCHVLYFGTYQNIPCDGVQAYIAGLSELSLASKQEAHWEYDIHNLKNYEIVAVITMAGYSGTMSCINNPNFATVQACGVRYAAPILNVIHRLAVPRIVINQDPRTYPREQEMSLMWPELIPCALLDQCNNTVYTTIGRQKYKRKSVYAAVESWAQFKPYNLPKDMLACMIAHKHSNNTIRRKTRAWDVIIPVCKELGIPVHGNGWEEEGYYCVSPTEAMKLMSRSQYCPIVGLKPGFYSGKIHVVTQQKCCPLLWDGDEYAYDPFYRYIPPDSPLRFQTEKELLIALSKRMQPPSFKPSWAVFDQMIDDLLADKPFEGKYGGYTKA